MATKTVPAAIVVEVARCTACRSCEMACAVSHSGFQTIVEAVLADAPLVPRVRVVPAGGGGVPVQCRHCPDPACVEVCPVDALHRDEEGGPVLLDREKCVSCEACVIACPYGAIEHCERLESVVKCDLCAGIVEPGEAPRCVSACPTSALRLGQSDAEPRDRGEAAGRA